MKTTVVKGVLTSYELVLAILFRWRARSCVRHIVWLWRSHVSGHRSDHQLKPHWFIKNLLIHQNLVESTVCCRDHVEMHVYFVKNLLIHQNFFDSSKTRWFIKTSLMTFSLKDIVPTFCIARSSTYKKIFLKCENGLRRYMRRYTWE